MKPLAIVAALISTGAAIPSALAQEGSATGSAIGGHNTVQQAPSGGTTTGRPDATTPDAEVAQPTRENRQREQQENAASQICKGC